MWRGAVQQFTDVSEERLSTIGTDGSPSRLLIASFLFDLLLELKNGDSKFLRNVGGLISGYTALYPLRLTLKSLIYS
jgi:hypothetical protein